MTTTNGDGLEKYFEYVMAEGRLRSIDHARIWSDGVLKTLGSTLDRGTKKALANKLPKELSESLNGVFWLMHFRDPNQTSEEFLQRVARRSGNSDGEFARYPTQAVFGGLKMFIDAELNEKVAGKLSPGVRRLWELAEPAETVPVIS